MNHESKTAGRILIVMFFITAFSGLMACEDFKIPQPEVDPSVPYSLQTDIQPIFTGNCISCHGGSRSPDLREGKSYKSLTDGGYVALPAETSLLYSTITGSEHYPRSTSTEKLKILYWIEQGAQDN